MSSVLWTVGAVAFCLLLLYIAHRIEPHWVSKDSRRFLTTSEPIDRFGTVIGRRREIRGAVLEDGGIALTQRALVRSTRTVWRIEAKSPKPPAGKQVYVLRPIPPTADESKVMLRMPADSELVEIFDRLLPGADTDAAGPESVSAPTPDPRSRRWGRRADRG